MNDKQFTVLKGKLITSVPWSLLAPHRGQAIANHGQSLERLNERGGLSAAEMMALIGSRRWSDIRGMFANDAEAEAALINAVAEFLRPDTDSKGEGA